MAKKIVKNIKKPVKVDKGKGCSTSSCRACNHCSWLMPLIIIVLIWWNCTALWAKVVITIAAALIALGKFCPCRQ